MAADDFFSRWSKPATALPEVQAGPPDLSSSVPQEIQAAGAVQDKPLPTLQDVAKLNRDSDFSPFMAKGVDQTVLRSAMKKLFADPHFNLMDGLDTYIGDYNKFEPIPPEMLALLNHAKALLNPLAQFEEASRGLIEPIPVAAQEIVAQECGKCETDASVATPASNEPEPAAAIAGAPAHQNQGSGRAAPDPASIAQIRPKDT